MRRDMSLIRERLLQVDRDGESVIPENHPEADRIRSHHEMINEAGLAWIENGTRRLSRLTWEGRDFVDLCRNDAAWEWAKRRIESSVGSAPFEVWVYVLTLYHQEVMS